MKHNVFAKIWAFLLAIFIISSCSNENEIAPVALGTYQRIVIIGSDGGESMEENKGKTAYFGGIDKAKFKRKVVPGDRLRLECEIIKRKGPVGVGKAVATVDGKVAVSAELTFMIG